MYAVENIFFEIIIIKKKKIVKMSESDGNKSEKFEVENVRYTDIGQM